jgi:hypothetical protein
MKKGRLTDEFLQSIHFGGSQKMYTDGEGLAVMASSGGFLQWRMGCSIKGKMIGFGLPRYPIISIKEARFARDIVKSYVKKGIDPRDKIIEIYGAIRDFREGKTQSARDFIYHNNL